MKKIIYTTAFLLFSLMAMAQNDVQYTKPSIEVNGQAVLQMAKHLKRAPLITIRPFNVVEVVLDLGLLLTKQGFLTVTAWTELMLINFKFLKREN